MVCFYAIEDLMYRSSTNDVVGYADNGETTFNALSSNFPNIADHMLGLYVRGV